MLKFEIKKLLKKHYVLVFFILALALVIYANYFADYRYIEGDIRAGYQGAYYLEEILNLQEDDYETNYVFGVGTELVGVSDEMAADYAELEAYKPKMKMPQYDGDGTVHWYEEEREQQLEKVNNPDLPFDYYQKLDAFIKKYNLYLDPTLAQRYQHMLDVHQYLEDHQIDLASFSDKRIITYNDIFIKNIYLFFGLLPLLLLYFMTASSVSEEYEKEQVFFSWILPVNRLNILLTKIISMLILTLCYILFIFAISIIISWLRGNFIFYALYPYIVYSLKATSIPLIVFIAKVCLIFILKALYLISIGTLFGLIFKKRRYTNLAVLFSALFGSLITKHILIAQHFINPFDTNYFDYIVGRIAIKSGAFLSGEYYATFVEPNFSVITVVTFSIILMLIFGICYFMLGAEKRVSFEKKVSPVFKRKHLFNWENYKQSRFISRGVIYTVFIIFLVSVFYGINKSDLDEREWIVYDGQNGGQLLNQIENVKLEIEYIEATKNDEIKVETESAKVTLLKERKSLNALKERLKELEEYRLEAAKVKDYFTDTTTMAYYHYLEEQYRLSHDFSNAGYAKKSLAYVFEDIIPESAWNTNDVFINHGVSAISYEINDSFRQTILKTQLKPMAFYFDRVLTYYDKTKNIKDINQAIANQQPHDISSFILLYRIFDYTNYPMILIVVIALLFGANYASDFERGQQLSFVYTQPLSRRRYYDIKYLSGLASIFKFLGVIIVCAVGIGLFFDPNNTLSYPVLKYIGVAKDLTLKDFSAYYTFISLGEYLVRVFIMTIIGIVFLYSLLQTLSAVIHNRGTIYAVFSGIGVILYFALLSMPQYAGYNPLIYLNPAGVVNGSLAVKYGFLGVEFSKGVGILFALSLLSCFVGRYLMYRKPFVK